MGKVIRSQLFELKKSRVLYIFGVGVLVIGLAISWMCIEWTETKTVSEYIAAMNGLTMSSLFVIVLIAVITGSVCAGDFPDKTINHEITSGTLRKDSFFGRAVIAIAVSTISAILIITADITIMTLIYGWGDTVTLGSAVKRISLLVFPCFKFSCFCVLLSFIIKQPYAPVLASILINIVTALISHLPKIMIFIMSYLNAGKICVYNNYCTYGLNTDPWFIYDESIDPKLLAGTIVASVLLGVAYLLFGYHYFRKDDLN